MSAHDWFMDEDDAEAVDIFRLSSGYHNGPECRDCGLVFCHHCEPEKWESDCLAAVREHDKFETLPKVVEVRSKELQHDENTEPVSTAHELTGDVTSEITHAVESDEGGAAILAAADVADRAMEKYIALAAAVEALAGEWEWGHRPIHWSGYVVDLQRILTDTGAAEALRQRDARVWAEALREAADYLEHDGTDINCEASASFLAAHMLRERAGIAEGFE